MQQEPKLEQCAEEDDEPAPMTTLQKATRPLTAQVLSVKRHPNADRLVVVRLDAGGEHSLQTVVEGTVSNDEIAPGDLVAIVPAGGHMPLGGKVRRETFRGVRSEARILSYEEVGLAWDPPDRIILLEGNSSLIGGTATAVLERMNPTSPDSPT
jgi:tRNA-binding EMAP/Myf-like protein